MDISSKGCSILKCVCVWGGGGGGGGGGGETGDF